MQTKPYSLQSPEDIAMEYGGNKQAIARAMQLGRVDPTAAVLAGMFIDRVRSAEALEKIPNQTIAERTFAPAQPPAGLGATAPAQGMAPPPMQPPAQPPAQMPTMTAADGGLLSLSVPESMYNEDSFAGGGIVAFDRGGEVPGYAAGEFMGFDMYGSSEPAMPRRELIDLMTLQELQEYNRTKKIPARLQEIVGERAVSGTPILGGGFYAPPARPKEIVQEQSKAAPGPSAAGSPEAAVAKAVAGQEPAPSTKPDLKTFLTEMQGLGPQGKDYEQLEKDVLAEREKRAADKSEAGWMRLAEAGLGIAAGTSPYALVNIGKGAAEALKGYAADLKDQKKLDREDRKILADIEKARRDEERGDIKSATDRYEKALDRMSAEERTRMTVTAYKQPAAEVQLYNLWASQQPPGADKSLARFKREMGEASAEAKDPMLAGVRERIKGKGSLTLSEEDRALLNKWLR